MKRKCRQASPNSKTEIFSVSFSKSELTLIKQYIERLSVNMVGSLSRNAFIRKVTMVHIKYISKGATKEYKELFEREK